MTSSVPTGSSRAFHLDATDPWREIQRSTLRTSPVDRAADGDLGGDRWLAVAARWCGCPPFQDIMDAFLATTAWSRLRTAGADAILRLTRPTRPRSVEAPISVIPPCSAP
jgi:hypothetical protein